MYKGLTDNEVLESRNKHGSNELKNNQKNSFLKLLLESLGDPIIRILIIALGIKLIFLIKDFDWYETVGIVVAIFLASFISSLSEYGSEKAFAKLQEEASKIKCRVRRNGVIKEINSEEVVVGDIVLLQAGDKVPADGVIVEGELSVDESSLNGETKEVKKEAIGENGIADKNSVFRGTVIYANEATIKITNVGDNTFYGTIAKELQEKPPESPLKLRLRGLATIISKIGYIGAFLVSISYLFSVIVLKNNFDLSLIKETITNFPVITGHILHALTLSVTIIVVAVPEGLPMMITLVLSSNMKRMLKNNVMVRKMVGIETAGSLNILFTDKTGTLTKGKMEMIKFLGNDFKSYKSEKELMCNPKYYDIIKKSIIYNTASSYSNDKKEIIGGNITDRAILNFIKSDDSYHLKKIDTMPFDSKNKYSKTTILDSTKITLIKGAPEKILSLCTKYYNNLGEEKILMSKSSINFHLSKETSKGFRVIAFATSKEVEMKNLTLVGFALIKDDVRKEAVAGLKLINQAKIQTVMITGDNKDTALAIGRETGIIKDDKDIILTSDDLRIMSDEKLKSILPNLRIVARSLPHDKSRLVRISQELGLVVGMTGDGVNDAPALKKADVGFSMGSGTEVAKEASDIIILDDNLYSISKAILFGRTIFKSIRKFIIFQLTVNICAVSLSIIGPFIGIQTPVTVIQMLWINMVMDTFAGLAFSFEPPLDEYMAEPPKCKEEPIINRYMRDEIIFTGIYSSLLCLLFLKMPLITNLFRNGENNEYLMSAFFGLFIFIGIFNCFNARTHRLNLLSNLFKNKVFIIVIIFIIIVQMFLIYYGGDIFRTTGLTLQEVEIMILLASTVIPIDWLRKVYLRLRGNKGGV
ncbi:MAG: calcium-translocating P-type ATPase, PMCA-type [Firmicutes bacterium]|nr:calcium-translocating P-type ATPase, PMCA-type [Bacillota bacterium]